MVNDEINKNLIFNEYQDKIRRYFQSELAYKHVARHEFVQIMASLDVLADTENALWSFFNIAPKDSNDKGTKYLFLYGLFSALYLQHEAINFLYGRIVDNKEKRICNTVAENNEKFKLVRRLRMGLASHTPSVSMDKNSCYFIIQHTMNMATIDYEQYKNGQKTSGTVKSAELLKYHSDALRPTLDKILTSISGYIEKTSAHSTSSP